MAITPQITLFYYPESIYSRRIVWYLHLRALPYNSLIQPPYLPRPDLSCLHINYRRIPICAIGAEVYCDSRLIITKLEQLFPHSPLACPTTADAGVRKLFESWSIDGGIFNRAVQLMPYWRSPLLQDPKFVADRAQMMGRKLDGGQMARGRPEALAHIRQAFQVMETTFLADGRDWILGTGTPTTADVDAVWVFWWLLCGPSMKGSFDGSDIGKSEFPRTVGYVERFMATIQDAERAAPKSTRVGIDTVREQLLEVAEETDRLIVDSKDPLKLKQGDEVEVWPIDSGFNNHDRGTLIGLSVEEVVIRNAIGIRLHYPRWNFRIVAVTESTNATQAAPVGPKRISPMRLIYHPRSPYSRKVYMLAIELGIEHAISLHKVVVAPIPYPGWSDNNDEVAEFNPLAKLPTLVPEDFPEGIFDSRTICDFLEAKAESPRRQGNQEKDNRYWQLRTLHACADGILDARVLVTYELRIREERGLKFDAWIEGQQLKVMRALDRLETAASAGILPAPPIDGAASAAEIAVATALGIMDVYKSSWREERPALAKWFRGWETRKSYLMTNPEQEWEVSSSQKDQTSKI